MFAPRTSQPGPWASTSHQISGSKYPACDPKTTSGWPVADRCADTSSALESDVGDFRSPLTTPVRSGHRALSPLPTGLDATENHPGPGIAGVGIGGFGRHRCWKGVAEVAVAG